MRKVLQAQLEAGGYRLWDANLPKKLLAARSGLARYGRNNIAYIPGMGSYFRLLLFASDLPAADDIWQEAEAMELCTHCTACLKACPTGAILEDRFLLSAERCLTYHNERTAEFPDWLDSDWHHCLVGCMHCQLVCPENKDVRGWVEEGPAFSEQETALLLQGTALEQLPSETAEKLRQCEMGDFLEVVPRNLRALLGEVATGT